MTDKKTTKPPPLPEDKKLQWQEKRHYPRFNYVVEVNMHSEHQFFTGLTNDISEGGLFINTYETLPVGTKLVINIVLPGMKEPTDLVAEVVWVRPPLEMNDNVRTGMGLRLIDPSPQLQKAIKRYVKRHEPMFYEV